MAGTEAGSSARGAVAGLGGLSSADASSEGERMVYWLSERLLGKLGQDVISNADASAVVLSP